MMEWGTTPNPGQESPDVEAYGSRGSRTRNAFCQARPLTVKRILSAHSFGRLPARASQVRELKGSDVVSPSRSRLERIL